MRRFIPKIPPKFGVNKLADYLVRHITLEQLCQTGIQLLYLSHYLAYHGAVFYTF